MSKWNFYIILVIIVLNTVNGIASPRKRKVSSQKTIPTWVKDNARIFTSQQAEGLDSKIRLLKDSTKVLPGIYVVTQKNYNSKSAYFRAIASSIADDKWFISYGKDYPDDLVILVRPPSKMFETPQLYLLCDKNSVKISRFLTPAKIDQLQNEYNKLLRDLPNTDLYDATEKLINTLQSRFYDGQVRDYAHLITPKIKAEIEQLVENFTAKTEVKVAVVTTTDDSDEDSAFSFSINSDKQVQPTIDYNNLGADLVFIFSPNQVRLFSQLNNSKLSDKAIQNLVSEVLLPETKSAKYKNTTQLSLHKEALQMSLTALSEHFSGEKPLDGMTLWQKLSAAVLGVGIPLGFGWLIFKASSNKKKKPSTTPVKPAPAKKTNKPTPKTEPTVKPEKKEDKIPHKPDASLTSPVSLKTVPTLVLTKPDEENQDRGWTMDNTASLSVSMNRIDEVFKPISPRNNHEKAILEMVHYVRSLREYTDQEITHSLPPAGLCSYLDELYGYLDQAAVRAIFGRGLDLLLKDYALRDNRVTKYVKR